MKMRNCRTLKSEEKMRVMMRQKIVIDERSRPSYTCLTVERMKQLR